MKFLIFGSLIFIKFISCTSNNSKDSGNQDGFADSLNIPEHIRVLDDLSVFSTGSKPSSAIRFLQEQQFGELYPVLLPPTGGFGQESAVDDNGNVYIVNKERFTIHVYNPDGSAQTDIGREGKGPGEFMAISAIHIHQDKLFVYDSNLTRIQIFTLKPIELSGTIILNSQQWAKFDEVRLTNPSTIMCITDSTFLVGVMLNNKDGRSRYGYYTLDLEGILLSDKIFEEQRNLMHERGNVIVRLPFTTKGILDVARDGTIYHINTGEFLIRIYNSGGDFQRAIYYPYNKEPLEREEALNQFHPNVRSVISSADFPEFWPALEYMLVDDENRIWLSTIIDDKQVYEWWVLKHTGELIDKFVWPRNKLIEIVKNDKVYVRETEPETGLQQIVRYRIEMEEV